MSGCCVIGCGNRCGCDVGWTVVSSTRVVLPCWTPLDVVGSAPPGCSTTDGSDCGEFPSSTTLVSGCSFATILSNSSSDIGDIGDSEISTWPEVGTLFTGTAGLLVGAAGAPGTVGTWGTPLDTVGFCGC